MLHKSGDDSEKVTPVPIPNTEVKLLSADGSWGMRPCESRTLPGERQKFTFLSFIFPFLIVGRTFYCKLTPTVLRWESRSCKRVNKESKMKKTFIALKHLACYNRKVAFKERVNRNWKQLMIDRILEMR